MRQCYLGVAPRRMGIRDHSGKGLTEHESRSFPNLKAVEWTLRFANSTCARVIASSSQTPAGILAPQDALLSENSTA